MLSNRSAQNEVDELTMYVKKLLKDKRSAQGRVRRPWNAWSGSSEGGSRGISFSSGSEFSSSEKITSCVVTPPPMSFSKQAVRSLTSSDESDSFFKPLRLGRVKKGLTKQVSASGVATQPSSPSSYGTSGSRSSRSGSKGAYHPQIEARKQKKESDLHNVSSGSSNSIESSDQDSRTRTDSTGSSQSAIELQDESDISESSSSTQEPESIEGSRNIEKIECLRTSSLQSNEEALVLQLKIPQWNTQNRVESLDVEYLAFKEVPAIKKCVKM